MVERSRSATAVEVLVEIAELQDRVRGELAWKQSHLLDILAADLAATSGTPDVRERRRAIEVLRSAAAARIADSGEALQ